MSVSFVFFSAKISLIVGLVLAIVLGFISGYIANELRDRAQAQGSAPAEDLSVAEGLRGPYSSDGRIATPSAIRSGVSKLKASRADDVPPAPDGKKSAPLTNVTPASVDRAQQIAPRPSPRGKSIQRK